MKKNSNYQSVISRLSALPNGSYEICVEVIDAKDNSSLGVSCLTQEVLNLSQVTLMYPEDNAVIGALYYEDEEDITQRKMNKAELIDAIAKGSKLFMIPNNGDTSIVVENNQRKMNKAELIDAIAKGSKLFMTSNEGDIIILIGNNQEILINLS